MVDALIKAAEPQSMPWLRGPSGDKLVFLEISIVIDSDRGHCYEHFKEKKLIYDENWARDMYLNVCVYDEVLSCQKWQKMKFLIFQAQPASVNVISSLFSM